MQLEEIKKEEFKKILIELLDEFDSFCKKNSIDYFLLFGTLLGAVRHKGFIPWDDDIDVGMLRNDYERFINSFKPSSEKFELLCLEKNPRFLCPYAKLVHTGTILLENIRHPQNTGVWLDIFPLDNCPPSERKTKSFINSFKLLRFIVSVKTLKISKNRSFLKNGVLLIGRVLFALVPLSFAIKKISKKAKKFKEVDSPYVGEICLNPYGMKQIYKKEVFLESQNLLFEGKEYKVPSDFDYVLSKTYGEYMSLPAEKDRSSNHSFKCFYK